MPDGLNYTDESGLGIKTLGSPILPAIKLDGDENSFFESHQRDSGHK